MFTTASLFYAKAVPLARAGYPVFPLIGKLPAIPAAEGGHGCNDGTTNETIIQGWAAKYPNANVGITFRNGTREIGLDVDRDNFWWLDRVQREHGIIETKSTKTAHGGFHFYLLRPPGMILPNVPKKANRGYELKSNNQYLVAPGSVIVENGTGLTYELAQDIDAQPMPQWLIEDVRAYVEGQGSNAPRNIGDFLNRLLNVKSVQGGWTADCPCPGHDPANGRLYVQNNSDKALVECSDHHSVEDICKALSLVTLTYSRGSGNGHHPPTTTTIFEGQGRNSACASEAGRLIHVYKDTEIVKRMVLAYNEQVCSPPLAEEELQKTVFRSLAKWAQIQQEEPAGAKDTDNLALTDIGNMERLIRLHGENFRWEDGPDHFNVWNGRFWEEGNHLVAEFAKTVCRVIYDEAGRETDDEYRKKLAQWARHSESKSALGAMVELSKTDPRIHTFPADYDRGKDTLNVRNGTVDFRTGALRPHRKEDYLTRIIDIDYIPGRRSEIWDKFVERILPNPATRSFTKQAIGKSATGDISEQIMPFCHGEGNNGKSTLLGAVRTALGPYAHEVEPDVFMQRKYGHDSKSPDEEIGNLFKKRFVTATELEDNETLAVSFVKRATGGEELTRNMKYQHSFKFKPEFYLWMSGNHQPQITDRTNSIWRRLKLIPFNEQIPESERIKGYDDILAYQHGEAILVWIVEGAVECYRNGGLTASEEIMTATAKYRNEQDDEWQFLHSDHAFIDDNKHTARADTKALYEVYKTWWYENNDGKLKPIGKKKFNQALKDRFHLKTQAAGHNRSQWIDVGIISNEAEEDDGG